MRARRIFRGALAGVMAVSLLFSGIPAAAAELNGPAPQNEAADNAGTDPMPKQQGNPGESEVQGRKRLAIREARAAWRRVQLAMGARTAWEPMQKAAPGTRAAWKPVQKAAAGARTVMGMKKTVMEAKILLNRRKTQIQNRLAVKMGRLKKMRRQR